jgi:hypothetical protein
VASTKSPDEETGASFGARDLRTRSPAYVKAKIHDLGVQIGVFEARLKTQMSLSRSDESKLCRLQNTLRVFNKKLHS